MTQVEIAKKILEQGNCHGMKCSDIDCPMLSKVNQVCMADYPVIMSDSLYKVKQWLKEKENKMIDLTVNQIVEPAVRCWVRGDTNSEWMEEKLHSIDHRFNHPYKCSNYAFKTCTIIDPTKPKFKPWLKVEDVPVELWGKALYKRKKDPTYPSDIFTPFNITNKNGSILSDDLVYLPLGQPLTGEWLEMGEWV